MNAQTGFDPQRAADHVLQEQRGRQDQAADEATPGRIVAAQQEKQRNQDRHRQQQTHQHRGQHHIACG